MRVSAAGDFDLAPVIGRRAGPFLAPGKFPFAIERNRVGLERLRRLGRCVQCDFDGALGGMLD